MQIKFLPEQNFELLSEISIRKNFSSISFFSKVQRVRIRRRNTTPDANFIWKFKNIFEELSFDFSFLQFAIHRAIPRVARKNNVETKIGKFLERIGKVSIEDRFFPPSHPLLRPLRRVSSRESFLFQPTIEKFPSKISCRWEVLLNNVYARSFVRLPSLLHFPRPILRLQLVNSLTRKFEADAWQSRNLMRWKIRRWSWVWDDCLFWVGISGWREFMLRKVYLFGSRDVGYLYDITTILAYFCRSGREWVETKFQKVRKIYSFHDFCMQLSYTRIFIKFW